MGVKAGDYLLLVGSGQRQFSLSHPIVGLFRGARVIVAAPDDFQAEKVRAIGEARGGTPDLYVLDMRDPTWTDQVLELTDGVGPDKVADAAGQPVRLGRCFPRCPNDCNRAILLKRSLLNAQSHFWSGEQNTGMFVDPAAIRVSSEASLVSRRNG